GLGGDHVVPVGEAVIQLLHPLLTFLELCFPLLLLRLPILQLAFVFGERLFVLLLGIGFLFCICCLVTLIVVRRLVRRVLFVGLIGVVRGGIGVVSVLVGIGLRRISVLLFLLGAGGRLGLDRFFRERLDQRFVELGGDEHVAAAPAAAVRRGLLLALVNGLVGCVCIGRLRVISLLVIVGFGVLPGLVGFIRGGLADFDLDIRA